MITNIAITGASGNLGSAISDYLMTRNQTVLEINSNMYRPCFDQKSVEIFLSKHKVNALIHCASMTNVDICEEMPKLAYESNVELTRKISMVARGLGCKLVFISSSGVYSPNHMNLLSEESITTPKTVYHKSKLEAEEAVLQIDESALILRVGWLFGGKSKNGKDFVKARAEELLKLNESDEYPSNSEQIGNPTSSYFVAKSIKNLLDANAHGIFNCVNTGSVSRYEFIKEIASALKIKRNIIPLSNDSFYRVADVPLNESCCHDKISRYIQEEGWDRYLVDYCKFLKS